LDRRIFVIEEYLDRRVDRRIDRRIDRRTDWSRLE
jgi:hypothetical protein